MSRSGALRVFIVCYFISRTWHPRIISPISRRYVNAHYESGLVGMSKKKERSLDEERLISTCNSTSARGRRRLIGNATRRSVSVEFDSAQLQGSAKSHVAARAGSTSSSGEEIYVCILARNFSREINQPGWIQRCCISHPRFVVVVVGPSALHRFLSRRPQSPASQERKIRKRK